MEIVIRATIIFFFLWLITRAIGKRGLAEATAFELIVLVTLGDLVQQGVTQEDMSLTGAMLAVATFSLWGIAFSWLAFRWRRGRRLLEGAPVVVVFNGEVLDEVLRAERLTRDELDEAARHQGIGDLAEVSCAVLEADGKVSFLQASGETTPGADDRKAG